MLVVLNAVSISLPFKVVFNSYEAKRFSTLSSLAIIIVVD